MFSLVVASVMLMGLVGGALANPAAERTGKFTLDGTAQKAHDPTNPRPVNHVISIDTSAPDTAGSATRVLNVQVDDLDGLLSLRYYIDSGDCGGGSPRISLRIHDGDGTFLGHIHGHVDPNSLGCPAAHDAWQFADLTDAAPRWETGQLDLGLGFVVPWDVAAAAIYAAFPDHTVVQGLLVDDSAWHATAAGLAYYDDVTIGNRTLSGPSDILGN